MLTLILVQCYAKPSNFRLSPGGICMYRVLVLYVVLCRKDYFGCSPVNSVKLVSHGTYII